MPFTQEEKQRLTEYLNNKKDEFGIAQKQDRSNNSEDAFAKFDRLKREKAGIQEQPQQGFLSRFADISGKILGGAAKATGTQDIVDVIGGTIVGATKAMAKPFGEAIASGYELAKEKPPEFTESLRLSSPEMRAAERYGITPKAGEEAERLREAGAKGADIWDALNVLALYPGTEVAKTVAAKIPSGIATRTTAKTALKTKVPELVGKITQAVKPADISKAERALGGIETTGIKTFKDLSQRLDTAIDTGLKTVDDAFSRVQGVFKPTQLRVITEVPGKRSLKTDYVSRALEHLSELYSKIEDPQRFAKITELYDRYKKTGLSASEINNIARSYGTEFGSKAFGKTGEALTSINARAYENIRTGVKEAARKLLPKGETTAKETDKLISDMIRTKELSDKMAQKVLAIQNKLQKAGLLQKAGYLLGHAIDIASGGALKAAFKSAVGYGVEGVTKLDAIGIEKQLQSNLKKLQKVLDLEPVEAVKTLKRYFGPGAAHVE